LKILIFTFFLSLHAAGIAQCDDFTMTITANNPTCHGFSDGFIGVDISGGVAPYTVNITNEWGIIFYPHKTVNMFPGGWYFIYAQDGNGCELFDSVFLANPP
jgi:hypothetical protein